jgi:hypothetical protein
LKKEKNISNIFSFSYTFFLTHFHLSNTMTTSLFLLILYLMPSSLLITSNNSIKHPCQVESYTETVNLLRCLSTPLSIKTARCRGQCYSEDSLIYDWRYAPKHYRHNHHLHCCSPNRTTSHEIQVLCNNKQFQTIKYRIITQCECKLCSDKCLE